ncbi:MAG TPA: hypothetical protein VE954_08490 [Oligoflexus sp.]|uniref:hypothetical protein n=1 Tax=Oligoflexus sp. TaxID=1971216 RepID=UPI002D6E9B61|nr:hypothetical protein [Oligoflexus sp.]HYX33141.1 hypothetical protein [Oligoflexus sp.]
MKLYVSILAASLLAGSAFGGGTTGGGSPPAMKELKEYLMSNPDIAAGVFDHGNGNIGLGINGALSPELRMSKSSLQSFDMKLSDIDFDLLRSNKFVEAVSLKGSEERSSESRKSYSIEDGDALGELRLKDRRELARESAK